MKKTRRRLSAIDGEIVFPDGLPGLESQQRFVLVGSPDFDPFTLIKGIGENAPAFLAIDPRRMDPAFPTKLGSRERLRLGAEAGETLLWLALVAPKADGTATVNLRAPIVISPSTLRGLQIVSDEKVYRLDHPLKAA
jgi:flagellar assembly factor FliW